LTVDTIRCDFSPTLVLATDVKQISSFEEKELLASLNVFFSPTLAPLSFSLHHIQMGRGELKEHKSVIEEVLLLFRSDVITKSIAWIYIWSTAAVGTEIHLRDVSSVSDTAIVTTF
jgi:hypothetical protein